MEELLEFPYPENTTINMLAYLFLMLFVSICEEIFLSIYILHIVLYLAFSLDLDFQVFSLDFHQSLKSMILTDCVGS